MIPRQMYRRAELKVVFPELDRTQFRTSKRNFGNRKNQGSPEFRVGTYVYPGSSDMEKSTLDTPKPPPLEKSQEALELEALREELKRKEEALRKLLEKEREPTPRPPPKPDPTRSLSPIDLYRLGVQQKSPSNSPPKILSQSPFAQYPASPFRSPLRLHAFREPRSYAGLPRSYDQRSPFYDRRILADYGHMLVGQSN